MLPHLLTISSRIIRIIRNIAICFTTLLWSVQVLRAQNNCGNGLSNANTAMRPVLPQLQASAKTTGGINYIPLQFHLISCSGSPEMNWYVADTTLVDMAIDTVNKQFLPADIQFCKAGPIDHIINDTFCDINYYTLYYHYKDIYPDTNVIHVYIPVGFGPSTTIIGYSFAGASNSGTLPLGYGMTGPAVSIRSSVLPNDPYGKKQVLAHELGHFFGLLHCNNYSFITGYELVNGSNGTTTGDFCHDTPAEYGDFFVDTNCVLIPALLTATDANGDTLRPDPYNIMSDNAWSQQCRQYFTPDQINRIKYYRTTYLSYLSCKSGGTAIVAAAPQQAVIRVSPNPASEMQTISLNCPYPARIQVDLYNMSGQLAQHIAHTMAGVGSTVLQANLTSLPRGLYYYRVAVGEAVQYLKVMKF